jgi:hypothetical protein
MTNPKRFFSDGGEISCNNHAPATPSISGAIPVVGIRVSNLLNHVEIAGLLDTSFTLDAS